MKLPNQKNKLSLESKLKLVIYFLITVFVICTIWFIKSLINSNLLFCIPNGIAILVIGYHLAFALMALKEQDCQKAVLTLISIDLCRIVSYFICPIYIIVALINHQTQFILPTLFCGLVIVFFILPIIRNWLE